VSHVVRWVAPAPLWPELVGDGRDEPLLRRPALLRLTADSFMDDLGELLRRDPAGLATVVARPASYRPRPPGHTGQWPPADTPLKLYQPAHGHFNMVAATLACALPGLPDHDVAVADREQVAFVMRRVGTGGVEEAWVGQRWTALDGSAAAGRAAGEDLMPLVPLAFARGGLARRLLVGLIPTASLETTAPGAAAASLAQDPDEAPDLPGDARVQELRRRVLDAQALIRDAAVLKGEDEARLVEPSRFVLLDLAVFLNANLPRVWAALQAASRDGLGAREAAVYDALALARPDSGRSLSWRQAATAAWGQRLEILGEAAGPPALDVTVVRSTLDNDAFWRAVDDALPPLQPGDPPPAADGTSAADVRGPKIEPRGTARYVVRCVYTRPLCGLLQPDLVSPPSEPFRIAPFFDLDAPGRPVQIALPFPSGIKDLRRFPHNVSMLISDELRQQLSRVRDAKKVLDGDADDPVPFDLGVVCSFSIPIITICALVLLLLIVSLLNIVFWWMPFFRICLPLKLGSGS
jgi:hypothetical protein